MPDASTAPTLSASQDKPCCPQFNRQAWRDRTLQFKDKLFLKARVRSVHYAPQDMEEVYARTLAAIDAAGAAPSEGRMVLSEDATPEQSHHYFAVSRPVPNCEMVTMTGQFRTRVVEGEYSETPNWLAAFRGDLMREGFNPNQIYCWYTTCPRCAARYGSNPVVLFAARIGGRIEPA